jgi:hypothetical protein
MPNDETIVPKGKKLSPYNIISGGLWLALNLETQLGVPLQSNQLS